MSGLLNLRVGGPGVFPELPAGVYAGGWRTSSDPWTAARRSIYIFAKRNLRYPLLEAFDLPDTHESCPRRSMTTTAPQALMLLNSEIILRQAQRFAARLVREAQRGTASPKGMPGDWRSAAVARGYRLALASGRSAPGLPPGPELRTARSSNWRPRSWSGTPPWCASVWIVANR